MVKIVKEIQVFAQFLSIHYFILLSWWVSSTCQPLHTGIVIRTRWYWQDPQNRMKTSVNPLPLVRPPVVLRVLSSDWVTAKPGSILYFNSVKGFSHFRVDRSWLTISSTLSLEVSTLGILSMFLPFADTFFSSRLNIMANISWTRNCFSISWINNLASASKCCTALKIFELHCTYIIHFPIAVIFITSFPVHISEYKSFSELGRYSNLSSRIVSLGNEYTLSQNYMYSVSLFSCGCF